MYSRSKSDPLILVYTLHMYLPNWPFLYGAKVGLCFTKKGLANAAKPLFFKVYRVWW